MEYEEEITADPVEKVRRAELALEEAEMAAAEAESCEMELYMLLKDLGLRD